MEYLGPLAALLILLHQTGALLKISTSSPQRAFAGSDVLLHCTFSIGGSSIDPRLLVIMWFYQGKEIVKYQDKLEISHPRVSFDERAARIGNASILLSDVKIEDEGIYMCSVTYSSEKMEEEIILNVLVSPKIQIPDKAVREDKENTLVCSVRDFYPVDIAIVWLRDGEILPNSLLGKIQKNKNGAYSVVSTMTITPDHERKNQTFSCRVRHESLPVPLQEDFQLVYEVQTEETSMIAVIIGVCCTTFLVVGIGLLIWKLKSRKKGGFTLSDIVGPDKLIDGEVVTLSCTGDHWPKKTQVIWLKEKAGGDPEIIQSHGGDLEEAEQLLNTSYVMDTKHMGSQRWSSNLRFICHMANHKGVTFICRFTSGKKNHEKRFHRKQVYAKPCLVEPVKMTLQDYSGIQISLCLERFYPGDIKITWRCVGKSSMYLISSKESVTKDNELTFNVTSECSVSGYVFIEPDDKVLVEWKHESLNVSECTSWSARDLPWRPMMEDIIIPKLEAGKEAALSCKISGYFPDSLSVRWIKKEKGTQSEIKLLDGDYKVPCVKSNEETDKTFTRETRLTLTPHPERDQGAEFICRVTHPTLEEPIEKRTGPLDLSWHPVMEAAKQTTLSCKISGYFPDSLFVKWITKEKGNKSEIKLPDGDYSVPVTDSNEEVDKTFTRETRLTFNPHRERDQGAEFICRVTHPTLEEPIERTTGPF